MEAQQPRLRPPHPHYTLDGMDRILDPPRIYAHRQGEEFLELLTRKRLDEEHMATHQADKRAREDIRKAQTTAKRAEGKKVDTGRWHI